ncbi:DUF4183 domain-containing protein [Paenibacillus spiritus]|nr:DUF4183 domain-containing protein [Paenibacillus spiritus]
MNRVPGTGKEARGLKRRSGRGAADRPKNPAQADRHREARRRTVPARRTSASAGRRRGGRRSGLLKARAEYYVAAAGEGQRLYTARDGNGVPLRSPSRITLARLYVNGILQPPDRYRLRRGRLILLSADTPAAGAPLVLEMVALRLPRSGLAALPPVRPCIIQANPVNKPLSSSYAELSDKKGVERPMPPSLIKSFMAASSVVAGTVTTTTTTSVVDTTLRFDTVVTGEMIDTVGGNTIIPAASFRTDTGDALTTTLPVVNPGGYYNVYVNGILQEGALSSLTPTGLTIASDAILPGTPVNLEIHDYTSTSSASSSVPSLTVSTTIAT